jgi:myosin heavy subunit
MIHSFIDFVSLQKAVSQYQHILVLILANGEEKKVATAILKNANIDPKTWQLGATKVFLKQKAVCSILPLKICEIIFP